MKLFSLSLAILVCTSGAYAATRKPATQSEATLKQNQRHCIDVFGRWFKDQRVLSDVALSEIDVNEDFTQTLREHLINNLGALSSYEEFLKLISGNTLSTDCCMLSKGGLDPISTSITSLLEDLDHNAAIFIETLCQSPLTNVSLNNIEERAPINDTISKQTAALRMLVSDPNPFVENKRLFALGNRLVEFCFEDKTFPQHLALYKNAATYPVLRFLNTAVWSTLVGEGWRHWHQNALDELQIAAQQGKDIVYIAGGADLYQFLRLGIYNVTILDPFYPTQDRYYSPGWEFLVASKAANKGLGDEIICGVECNNVKLVRSKTTESDYFYAKLSNEKIAKIRKSTTEWNIVGEDGNVLGSFTFKRCPLDQDDLAYDTNKVFVASYDEMICLAQPEMIDGWGTNPSLLDDRFTMIIKQFRKPVGKSFLQNLRVASMLNTYELKFIKFASDPT